MVLPALVAGLGAMYLGAKSIDSYRFYNDYYKNTGKRPRYPFHSGQYNYLGYGVQSFGKLKKF